MGGKRTRSDIRNLAIIAHVDHGKTTLVDAMLWQSALMQSAHDGAERLREAIDVDREKALPVMAKTTSIPLSRDADPDRRYPGPREFWR